MGKSSVAADVKHRSTNRFAPSSRDTVQDASTPLRECRWCLLTWPEALLDLVVELVLKTGNPRRSLVSILSCAVFRLKGAQEANKQFMASVDF